MVSFRYPEDALEFAKEDHCDIAFLDVEIIDKLKTFNNMYKVNIGKDKFLPHVKEAWSLLKKGDAESKKKSQTIMKSLFKSTLRLAFDKEKDVSYNDHRHPDYAEIIKSSNELLRSAMYGVTDLYHNPKSATLDLKAQKQQANADNGRQLH